jgi:uncharacterized membrane protein
MTTRSRQLGGRRRGQGAILALAGAILADPAAVFAQCQYEVTIIQAPEEPWGQPGITVLGLNELGAVVGKRCDYICDTTHWFLWTPEDGFTVMPHPPEANSSYASDINDEGVVVGTAYGAGFSERGFIYDHGEWTYLLPAPGGAWCDTRAINSAGVVVGERSIGDGVNPRNAYIWSEQEGYTDLGVMEEWKSVASDVNDLGVVVGTRGLFPALECFIWDEGKLAFLGSVPGGESSMPGGINMRGQVAITGLMPNKPDPSTGRVFIWRHGTWNSTELLAEYEGTVGRAINDRGQIVGHGIRLEPYSDFRAVLFVRGRMFDLNDLVPPIEGTLRRAFDINNRGQIIAEVFLPNPGVDVGILATPIDPPEGDLDGDCDVNVHDLLFMFEDWGSAHSVADLNTDGTVNVLDLLILLENWE